MLPHGHHGHHQHHHHEHDHVHDHTHDDGLTDQGFGPAPGFSTALWQLIKSYHLLTVAFVFIVLLAFVRLKRRRAVVPETNYDSEHAMNLGIRRARALEAMQQDYDRKAREYEEAVAKRREQEAAERAKRVGVTAPSDTSAGGGSGPSGSGGKGDSDWNPLMGSGPVGGFRSQRCVKRGG